MEIRISMSSDIITPDMLRLARNFSDRTGLHQAIGLGLVSIAKRAFNDAALRPRPWPNKTDGSPSRLRKSGTLAKSVRVVAATADGVTLGSDRHYAAIHQLGGKTKAHIIRPRNKKALFWPGAGHPVKAVHHPGSKIPARPYLPFYSSGLPTPKAITTIRSVVGAKIRAGMHSTP